MTIIDPEQERQRLAEFYAAQMDGELEKVADEAYELTDSARAALRTELAKRGLTPKFIEQRPVIVKKEQLAQPGDPPKPGPPREVPPAADGELEFRNLVTVGRFWNLAEAQLAKGAVQAAGIEAFLFDDNMVRLDWFNANALGGVKLRVDREDAAAAEEVLAQPIPEHFDVSGVGEFEQPRCPHCGSLDVNFHENAPAAYVATIAIGLPLPIHRRAWRCHNCTAEWEDYGIRDEAQSST